MAHVQAVQAQRVVEAQAMEVQMAQAAANLQAQQAMAVQRQQHLVNLQHALNMPHLSMEQADATWNKAEAEWQAANSWVSLADLPSEMAAERDQFIANRQMAIIKESVQ